MVLYLEVILRFVCCDLISLPLHHNHWHGDLFKRPGKIVKKENVAQPNLFVKGEPIPHPVHDNDLDREPRYNGSFQ